MTISKKFFRVKTLIMKKKYNKKKKTKNGQVRVTNRKESKG